jgi:transposase
VAHNFVGVDRDQLFLMPPSVAEWLPEDHLAWFVLDAVDELDLTAFVAAYRDDGRGGAAYHPAMMVALLVYAYAIGERSSRRIQRRCVEDVPFRVIAANQVPDHATIARFRATHADAITGLFAQVLALCARAGVLRVGLLAVDGTKLAANASRDANRTAEQLAAEIVAEAEATDAAEDAAEAADDSVVPEDVKSRGPRRRARLRELLDELEAEAEGKSFETHLERRAAQQAETGRPIRGRPPKPDTARHRSRKHANTTDPDSRLMPVHGGGFMQGYNAQTIVTEDQYVVAVEVINQSNDAGSFAPMVRAAKTNLRRAGARGRVRTVLADAGYFSEPNMNLAGVESLIAPGNARKLRTISEHNTARSDILAQVEAGEISNVDAAEELQLSRTRVNQMLRQRRAGQAESTTTTMIAKLDTPRGKRLYKKRSASVEPVFAQIKHNRKIRTLSRRGLAAANSEWNLITATHNLLKLWRHTNPAAS